MVSIHAPAGVPDGLLEAFWTYDNALLANDRAVLDELFLHGPDTVRGDGRVLLVGHDAIAGFRLGRAVTPTRAVTELHIRVLAAGTALVMARTRDGEATGLQTQVWQRTSSRWRVAAAHVSLPTGPTTRPAAALDESVWRVAGAPLAPPLGSGRLDGLGVAVKDLIPVVGHPVGGGVPAYLAEQLPQRGSAPAVDALQRAGAHLVGIAQTDEFAYSIAGSNSHYGAPPNPAAPGRFGGGSSSGPASAVALGQADIGLGTDTAGSVRVPSSYQGLVGLRTTHGVVPLGGTLPLAPSFDVLGWLTRDVASAAAVADVLLPLSAGARAQRTLRLPAVEALADPDTLVAFEARLEAGTAAGVLPPAAVLDLDRDDIEAWFAAFRTVQAAEAWEAHGAWLTAHPGALGPDVAARFAAAAAIDPAAATAACAVVAAARQRLGAALDGALLALPTTPGPAPRRDATAAEIDAVRGATLRMTCLAPIAGAPALSVPLPGAGGPPVGLCLIGAPGSDRELLGVSAALEEVP